MHVAILGVTGVLSNIPLGATIVSLGGLAGLTHLFHEKDKRLPLTVSIIGALVPTSVWCINSWKCSHPSCSKLGAHRIYKRPNMSNLPLLRQRSHN